MEDKQKRYLDKVVDLLVSDTKIMYNYGLVIYPFVNSSSREYTFSSDTIFQIDSPHIFDVYVVNTYAISWSEIEYVWQKYTKIIMEKFRSGGNINESEDKETRYLDKVLEKIINDTVFDRNNNKIIFPFSRVLDTPISQPLSYTIFNRFINYCIDTYALTSRESMILYFKYDKVIQDWLYNDLNINESEDKQNKYVDKVVDIIVKDTKIDFKDDHIKFPFYEYAVDFSTLNVWFGYLHFFTNYCEEVYNLNDDEIIYAWKRYRNIIVNKGNINESQMRNDNRYLEKVAELILKDTVIDYEKGIVYTPFTSRFNIDLSGPIRIWSTMTDYHYQTIINHFEYYSEDIYALNQMESEKVWYMFKKKLEDKIENHIINGG